MAGESKTDKAEQRAFSNAVVSVIFAILGTGLAAALVYLTTPIFEMLPVWLRYILVASCAVGILYFLWLLVRLGGAAVGSEHRLWYVDFRNGITSDQAGNPYARGVKRAIAWADRFLGDEDTDDKGIFPHAFGLREGAPLWTASSYDRSLLLALLYPVIAISLFWVIWGHVGQAEEILSIKARPVWVRGVAIISVAVLVFASSRTFKVRGLWPKVCWGSFAAISWITAHICGLGVISLILTYVAIFAIAFAIVLSATIAIYRAGKRDFTLARTVSVARKVAGSGSGQISIIFAIFLGDPLADLIGHIGLFINYTLAVIILVLTFFITIIIIPISIHLFLNQSEQQQRKGIAFVLFTIVIIGVSVWPLPFLSLSEKAQIGPYFFVLLTLVNAPFDWLAIGITRGLIRRGLERSGFWPIIFALADFALSLCLLALLALTTLWVTEVYSHAAIARGGKAIVDVSEYLNSLGDPAKRSNPEYYWLYAMLFSSQIPAIINMAFGALCLLRGLPHINRWMAARLPESGGIGSWARLSVATAQSLQLALAVAIGCIAYYLMVTFLIGLIDPIFGRGLVEILKAVRMTPLFG